MERLIQQLIDEGHLRTPAIIEAFRAVPRSSFLDVRQQDEAARNIPLPIGYGQTISQPLTVAFMLELVQPQPGERVLDVGAGSGWTAALLAYLVGERGRVVAIERIPQLRQAAREHLAAFRFSNIELLSGDGSYGAPSFAPFDCIHVAAAAKAVPPALRNQLARHGRLVIPIGDVTHTLYLITREANGKFSEHQYPGFAFVPLIEGPLP